MDIRNTRNLKTIAGERLENTRDEKKIVLIYAGIIVGLSALTTLISYFLNLQIDQSGGLSNLGIRSMLSTVQTMLPFAQMLFVMCLDLGYIAAMLRISRGQYTSPQTLRLGFDRFWPLLKLSVLQGLIFLGIGIVCIYLSMMLFLLTPLSRSFMQAAMPLMADTTALDPTILLDEALYRQLMSAMIPMLVLFILLFVVFSLPFFYRFRMTSYIIIDRPAVGAFAALRESNQMMKKHCFSMFRLDLSMWWYYGLLIIASIVCYGDRYLPMLGVALPGSADLWFFVFFALYLAMEFGIYYYVRNRVEVTYALAYEALRPEEKKDNSVVLGNIFHM